MEPRLRNAASPAVQPAAGRKEIARALDLLNEARNGGFFIGTDAGAKVEEAKDVLRAILAALAHPPAQGLSLSFTLEEARANMVQADGMPCFPPRPAALSQPGPASEGNGE